tara:strand:- start:854 stop:1792 length:939 start_codon:yes stop_codon:yes gene_type:complete
MAVDITKLSDEDLSKKIKSAGIVIERNTGLIKDAAEKKLVKLEAELESRSKKIEKSVEKVVDKVEKTTKKDAEKVVAKVKKTIERPNGVKSKKFRHKKTGKVVTQIPVLRIADYEEVKEDSSPTKKDTTKKSADSTEKFELTIDGKIYKFSDLASKEACEKATKAVQARYKEVKEHRKATTDGIRRASTVPVTQRISDGFISIAKKAVSEVPETKINKNPAEIKTELEAVEKAFNTLFDKLGDLMGKEIPKSQRSKIMDILTKFESKVDKGTGKKEAAVSKIREKKEDGGLSETGLKNYFGADNSWSYASLM